MALVYNPQTGKLEEGDLNDFTYDFGYGDPAPSPVQDTNFYDVRLVDPAPNPVFDFTGGESQDHDFTKEEAESLWKAGSWDKVLGLVKKYGKKALDVFKGEGGKYDLPKLATIAGGLYAASRPNNAPLTGYQGKIPKYTATRDMLTAPPAGRRPGSGGIDYGGGVTFKDPSGEVVSSNAREMPELLAEAMGNPFNRGMLTPGINLGPNTGKADEYNRMKGQGLTEAQIRRTAEEAYGTQSDTDWNYITGLANAAAPAVAAVPESPVAQFAEGGLAPDGFVVPADVVSHLGNGSSEAGLRLLASKFNAAPIKGAGDGMSDSIPTNIGGVQEARVANEEAFISPEVVAEIGGGNAQKGAKKLYAMMDRIREDRTGSKKQGKQIEPAKYMPGGSVDRYVGGGITAAPTTSTTPALTTARPTAPTTPSATTGMESSLSNFAGEYVTDMLGRGSALAQTPYQAYTGPLTAGPSALQQQAFSQASRLKAPASVGQAASTAGGIASSLASAPSYAASGMPQYDALTAQNVSSNFQAPEAYQAGQFDGGMFGTEQARQYMNPFLETSLAPQLAEARRQAEISRVADASRLTQAGAFGGSRQAIMESELNRNLGTRLADITGQGYNTAFTNAMSQFNADQSRGLAAQQATEQSRQFGAGQGLTAATTAGQQGLQAGMANQQAGLTAGQANISAALDAARQQEQSRQFGAGLGLQTQQAAIQAALAQGNLGNLGFQNELAGINALSSLGGTQRGIEAEGIAADRAQFEEARLSPFKMLQFEQSLLSGLPLASQSYTAAPTSNLQQFAQGTQTAQELFDMLLGDDTPIAPV